MSKEQVQVAATQSQNLNGRPRTKKEAFISLQMLINSFEYLDDNDKLRLAEIYNYFLPNKVTKRTVFDWVAQVVNPKEVRPHLRYIHVNEKHVIGTDGHRIHLVPLSAIQDSDGNTMKPGNYDKKGNYDYDGSTEDIYNKFPPGYEDVMREPPGSEYVTYDVSNLQIKPITPSDGITHIIQVGDYWYDYQYFIDAVGKSEKFEACQSESGGLFMKFPDGACHEATSITGAKVVIMPRKQ